MSASQDAMNTLCAQWYNAVTSGCGLDPNQFQLVQGATPVQALTENLWAVFDSVPPLSVSTYFNPSQLNSLSQDYGGIISALVAQGGVQFQNDMGDYYAAWNTYKGTISPIPSNNMAWINAFTAWANAKLPQAMVSKCIGDFQTMLMDPIAVAANQWLQMQYGANNPGVCAYTTTVGQLTSALVNGVSKSVTLDSTTTSSDVSKTWAKGSASGLFSIFRASGNASYSAVASEVQSAGVKVSTKFTKLVTLSAGPLKSASGDTYLQNYTPWYNGSALNEGYQKSDNTVWKAGDSISWNSSFGPNGNLLRTATALVIVDGITSTTTSKAKLSKQDQATFSAAAKAGIFPFFQVDGSGGWSTSTSFDDQGNVTVSTSSPAGNPQILGVLVSPISAIL